MKKDSGLKRFLRGLLTKEFLLYVVFGVLTTLVSIAVYYLCNDVCGIHYSVANIISWILAVTFAYVTNKFFVFQVKDTKKGSLFLEIALFYAARLFSLGVEEGGLYLCIDLLHMDSMLAKVILQVIVVALNYVFSKLLIFRRKKNAPPEQ